MESSTTNIDFRLAGVFLGITVLWTGLTEVFDADLIRSETLRIGTTWPVPSTVAPTILRT